MLKTIQMQKAKPTQKQNKKPTHNAGKITKKKLKKPRFIGGAKISDWPIKEKLEFLKHCLEINIDKNLKNTINGDVSSIFIDYLTPKSNNIQRQIIIIKYVLLCLCSEDITENNKGYLILKNNYKTIIVTEGYKNLFDDENLDDEIKTKLLVKAEQLYGSFYNYVKIFVDRYGNDSNNSTNTISNFTNYIFRIFNEIAILTVDTNAANKKHKLKIINNKNIKTEYASDDEIKKFFKINTNFLIIKNEQNNQYKDYYNCMMQIIMKLVDIFSSKNNSKYYEMIINGEPENAVYELMNKELKGNKLEKQAQQMDNGTITNQTAPETTAQPAQPAKAPAQPAKAPETPAKAPETPETLTTAQTTAIAAKEAAKAAKEAEAKAAKAAKEAEAEAAHEKAKAIAAAAKVEEEANAKAEKVEKEAKEEAEKAKAEKADKAETIKQRGPDINLDNLLDYIFNDGAQVFDLGKHAILLKSLKMICYNKFNKEIGITFKDKIDEKYIAKINETNTANKTRIINDSKLVYLLTKQGCNSSEMIEAYQHIINILVPKYGLDITSPCYETLIALSEGGIYGDCKKTIGDILTQKSYLLSEPKIKDLLIRKYLKDLGNLEGIAIEELKNFKQNVLEILNEILDVPAYKDTQSKVLKIYNSLHDIIVKDYEGNSDLIGVLVNGIENISRDTRNSNTYSNIQKTPEETKFDKLLDIIFKIFKIFQDIKTITGKSFSYTKHGIILRSLKLICYNKLNKLFRNYSEHIDSKYIDELIKMGFARQNIEGNESFKKHKSIVGISGNQYCNDSQMIKAYQDIINILYQGKTKPNIEDIKIFLLIDLSTGNSSPDCKKTINKIINDESYLLSESRIMDIELDGDFLITSWDKKKTYSSENEAVLALTKYNETIKKTIKKATIYDIKNELWKDYDDLSKKIKLQYTNNSNIVGALPAIPAINKPETKKMTKRGKTSMRTMATNMR